MCEARRYSTHPLAALTLCRLAAVAANRVVAEVKSLSAAKVKVLNFKVVFDPAGFARYDGGALLQKYPDAKKTAQQTPPSSPRKKMAPADALLQAPVTLKLWQRPLGMTLNGPAVDGQGNVYVTKVKVASHAEKAGVQVGMRVNAVDGKNMQNRSKGAVTGTIKANDGSKALVVVVQLDPRGYAKYDDGVMMGEMQAVAPASPKKKARASPAKKTKAAPAPRGKADAVSIKITGRPVGMSVTGPTDNGKGNVFVSKVKDDSLAANAGVRVGMAVLSVDGQSTENKGKGTTVKIMKANKGTLDLRLQLDPDGYAEYDDGALRDKIAQAANSTPSAPAELVTVTIADRPLGMSITGPKSSGTGHVFISKVKDASHAETAGVKIGMQIIKINGKSVLNISRTACMKVMKEVKGAMTLQLQMNPEGYATYDGGALLDSLAMTDGQKFVILDHNSRKGLFASMMIEDGGDSEDVVEINLTEQVGILCSGKTACVLFDFTFK